MRVHVPQARARWSRRVTSSMRMPARDRRRGARSGGGDAAVAHDHDRIVNRRAVPVPSIKRAPAKREVLCGHRRNRFQLRARSLIRSAIAEACREGSASFRSSRTPSSGRMWIRETIAANRPALVDPDGLAAPDDAVDGEAAEDRLSRRRRDGVGAALLDADVARRLARQHRQGLRACRAAPSNRINSARAESGA